MQRFKICFIAALMLTGMGAADAAGPIDSGFLNDYSNLTPDPELPGVWDSRKTGADPSKYKAVVVPEVEIWIAPDSPYKGIKPAQLAAVAQELHKVVVELVKQRKPIADAPGPNVAIIRVALTEVSLKKSKRRLLSYTPVGFAVHELRQAAGKNISIEDAQLEVMFVDGESGDVLVSMAGLPDKKAAGEKETSWSDIEGTIRHWGNVFDKRLDEFRQ